MRSRYELKLKRRRTGQTDYQKRLRLLLSRKPRLVVRKSLKHIRVQLAAYNPKGDAISLMAFSTELRGFGWTYSTSSLPAAYLTGLLCGKRAIAQGIKEAVLDIGLNPPVGGSKVYAALKGAVDAGLEIPANPEIFPKESRIKGAHIVSYAAHLKKENPELYKKRFSAHLAQKLDPEKLSEVFEQTRTKIMEGKK